MEKDRDVPDSGNDTAEILGNEFSLDSSLDMKNEEKGCIENKDVA